MWRVGKDDKAGIMKDYDHKLTSSAVFAFHARSEGIQYLPTYICTIRGIERNKLQSGVNLHKYLNPYHKLL